LFIGFFVVTAALFSGVTLGLVAGYFRGWVDAVIMRIMDIILPFPSLLLALVLVAILGPGLFNAMLAIALVLQPHFARSDPRRGLSEKSREYVVSAKVAGAGHLRLMFITILPNCLGPADRSGDAELSPTPFSRRPPSAFSAWAPSRRRRNGAPCWRGRGSSSPRPGGSSPCPASPS
jgi:dipeptide transport system permease protein